MLLQTFIIQYKPYIKTKLELKNILIFQKNIIMVLKWLKNIKKERHIE